MLEKFYKFCKEISGFIRVIVVCMGMAVLPLGSAILIAAPHIEPDYNTFENYNETYLKNNNDMYIENLTKKFIKNSDIPIMCLRYTYKGQGYSTEEITVKVSEDIILYDKLSSKYNHYNIDDQPITVKDLKNNLKDLPSVVMLLKYRNKLIAPLVASGIITEPQSISLSTEDLEKLADELIAKNNLAFKEAQGHIDKELEKSVNRELGVFYRKEVK